jgi:hypothetical protein
MMSKAGYLLGLGLALCAGAQERTKPHLTARELFYSSLPAAKPAATHPQAKVAAPKKSASPAAPVVAENNALPAAAPRVDLADGTRIVAAVARTSNEPVGLPLGLKYTILKKSGDQMVEVTADSVFHAGDRIQLNVETNGPGYLYIVSQGSSGNWKPMFPSAEVEDGNNRVEAFRTYQLPPKSRILFDEQTGTEKLFVVFSREPEPDLEKMIYSLRGGAATPAVAPKKEEPRPKTLVAIADASIDDKTVGLLRTAYSRDLVIEKVDASAPAAAAADHTETAVYVVNPSGANDSRVVADLQLVHR